MLLASFILVVAPCLALRFALRVAPALDATVSEAPHFAIARVALRWFAAVHSIVRGEADMTRVEPRGAYGAPSGAFADLGYPRTLHLRNDRDHLLGLWFAFVHATRTGEDVRASIATAFGPAIATSITTAALGLVAFGLFVHLPGLSPLRDRRW